MSAGDHLSEQQFGPVYHGTAVEDADSILREGQQLDYRNVSGSQSVAPDFYTSGNKKTAAGYADLRGTKDSGVVIEGTIHARNPARLTTTGPGGQTLRRMGHDYVEISGDDATLGDRRGVGVSFEAGMFHPTRLHYHDGETVDLT